MYSKDKDRTRVILTHNLVSPYTHTHTHTHARAHTHTSEKKTNPVEGYEGGQYLVSPH